jgi:mannosyltransferase
VEPLTADPDAPDAPAGDHPVAEGLVPPTRVERVITVLCWVGIAAGVVARFVPRPDLWLDEALSVNIASVPLGDLADALRRDGHPPLYYVLLHAWTSIGSTGSDWWVRALSGVISLATIPLAWVAGRRIAARVAGRSGGSPDAGTLRLAGLVAATVMAVLPYGIRYGSETRMYALVMVLVLAGHPLLDDLWSGRTEGARTRWRAGGLTLVTAALLWSHYWAMWLAAAVGIIALVAWWHAHRSGDRPRRRGASAAIAGLIGGGVLFLPWLPVLAYQSENTGTPWGEVIRPTTMVLVSIVDAAGRPVAEPQLLSYVFVALVLVALFGRVTTTGTPPTEVVVAEARSVPRVRVELAVIGLTLAIGWAASAAASGTFQARYAAVVMPLWALCIAAGLVTLRPRGAVAAVLAVVVAGSMVSAAIEVATPRSQAGVVADAIAEDVAALPTGAPPPVVLTCPDQLGPALARAVAARAGGAAPQVVPYPAAGDPRYVDWVDYAERNAAADPDRFVDEVTGPLPPGTTVYYVFTTGYLTFGDDCELLAQRLAQTSEQSVLVEADGRTYFENMGLWVYRPRA